MNHFTFSLWKKALLLLLCCSSVLSTQAQTQKGGDIDGEAGDNRSGGSVSMPDANTVAIGAIGNDDSGIFAGHVRIYEYVSGAWQQKGGDIDGESAGDESGSSVSMPDANTVAIGAPSNDGNGNKAGHVRIYEYVSGAWQQKGGDIDGEAADDQSGGSVSMPDANTVAIGARLNDGNGILAGHVRIYEWNSTTSQWDQKGSDIDGEVAGDISGRSVSMPDANTVAIGSSGNDGNGTRAGHVRIYEWNSTTSQWDQKGSDIDGEAARDEAGYSVSMPDANTVAIGAYRNDASGSDAGHVRIYEYVSGTWTQKGGDIDGEAADNFSGISVSMPDVNTVAIGAIGNNDSGILAGHVRIYEYNSGSGAWQQKGSDMDGEAADDRSGSSVSMPDANTVAIGAPRNDGSGSDGGHVRVYSLSTTSVGELGEEAPTNAELFPNPVNETLQLHLSDVSEQQEINIRIFTNLGQIIYEDRRVVNSADVVEIQEVSSLVPGSYYLQLSWEGEELALPFVKQ